MSFLPFSQAAVASMSCHDVYGSQRAVKPETQPQKKTFDQVEHQVHSINLQRLKSDFEKIYSRQDLSLAEQNKMAFDRYLDHRLAGFDKKTRDHIREKSSKIIIVYSDTMNGALNYETKQVRVELPRRFEGSVGDYTMRVHELEHYIQDVEMPNWGTSVPDYKKEHLTEVRFAAERGAMTAEAVFALSIPREIAISESEKTARVSRYSSLMHLGIKETNDPQQYVEFQWSKNRYSKAELEGIYYGKMAFNSGILATMLALPLWAFVHFMH